MEIEIFSTARINLYIFYNNKDTKKIARRAEFDGYPQTDSNHDVVDVSRETSDFYLVLHDDNTALQ